MSALRPVDMTTVDELFQADPGYVMDLSNRTYSQLFARELDIDIDDERYLAWGTSKMNRLRCFLSLVDDDTAARTLQALWEYRGPWRERLREPAVSAGDETKLRKLLTRLTGSSDLAASGDQPVPAFDRSLCPRMRDELNALWSLTPQARGLRFESYLRDLFAAFGLKPRGAFKLHGEQIDGSFLLGRDTYLLEAKWHQDPLGAAELRILQSKVAEKATWTRGLFVSFSGFTEEGLVAFGRGKSIICMSGRDLYDALDRELHLAEVLERKVRHAAETGEPYSSVRKLYGDR